MAFAINWRLSHYTSRLAASSCRTSTLDTASSSRALWCNGGDGAPIPFCVAIAPQTAGNAHITKRVVDRSEGRGGVAILDGALPIPKMVPPIRRQVV